MTDYADLVGRLRELEVWLKRTLTERTGPHWSPLTRPAAEKLEASLHESAAALTAMQTQYERGAYCLMEMMKAYERHIRTDCTPQEQIDKRPWECAEYLSAAQFLRATWKDGHALLAAREVKS